MKKNYSVSRCTKLLTLASVMVCNHAIGQWTDVSTTYTNVELFDVKFLDDNFGVTVGRDHTTKVGYIFRTTNGGSSWTTYTVPMTFFRAAGFASNVLTGNAAGYPDVPSSATVIYNTNNGGGNWTPSSNPLSYTGIEHMQFLNSTDGFATGYGSTFGFSIGVYRTTNGGATWSTVNSIGSTGGSGFFMTSPTTGFVTTYASANSGTILKTTNGGANFTTCYSGNWMKDVHFVSANNGFALEGLTTSSCIVTTNGGTNWSYAGTVGNNASAFFFTTQNDGWTIGGSGTIRATTNGGVNWAIESSTTTNDLNEISRSTSYLWVCGDQGTVLKKAVPALVPVSNFSSSSDVCVNAAVTFTDQSSNATIWNWSVAPSTGATISSPASQSPVITFSTAGTYSVSLLTSNGAQSGNTVTKIVTVHPDPSLTVSASKTIACINTGVTLTASGASTYSWTGAVSNTSASSTTFSTGTTTGDITFSVVGASTVGCTSSATITVKVNACVGLRENPANILTQVFPNPFSSELNISDFEGKAELFNMYGQHLLTSEVRGTQTIAVDHLQGHVFILTLYNNDGLPVKTMKLVKH